MVTLAVPRVPVLLFSFLCGSDRLRLPLYLGHLGFEAARKLSRHRLMLKYYAGHVCGTASDHSRDRIVSVLQIAAYRSL